MARRGLLLLAREVLRGLLRGPVTIDYGVTVHPSPPEGYRGLHRVDPGRCIGCSLCALECPSRAIEMVTVGRDEKGRPKRVPVVHYEYCVFCYHCVDICPRGAYVTSPEAPPPTEEPSELRSDRPVSARG